VKGRLFRDGIVAALCLVTAARAAGAGPAAPEPGPGAAPDRVVERARFLMGARLLVQARGAHPEEMPAVGDAIERAFEEVGRLEAVLSNWRADSEVSRLNRSAPAAPAPVSADLYDAVSASLLWAERTGGTFDPTVEPLVRRFGLRGEDGVLPGIGAPPAPDPGRQDAVGWRDVRIDPVRRTVAFARPGMGIDFGGIGKGMALDAAARVLEREGVATAMLDFAGQVLVFGRGPDAGGWRIGIADPGDRQRSVLEVRLESGSLATSGNSERAVVKDGRRVGHILDPRNARPVEWNGSVTVLADDATSADALTKALFVLGPARGPAWAEEHGIQVLYLERSAAGVLVAHGAGALFHAVPEGVARAGAEGIDGMARDSRSGVHQERE
jgi:FAD:protein FMN transferase